MKTQRPSLRTRVCVVGGGPAGMMVGYLLARAGIDVVVLEKHADFLRDFRGDTVHPSTLQVLEDCGLLDKFSALPQHRVSLLGARFGERFQPVIDFRGLHPFDFLSLVPQWDFLDLLAEEASRLPSFHLYMEHEVTGLVREEGRAIGARVHSPEGERCVEADLVIACDGRTSTVRDDTALPITRLGAPMDVLWFRLPRTADDPEETQAIVGAGHLMITLNRDDYWQTAYVVPKGRDGELRKRSIDSFRDSVAELAPGFRDHLDAIESWEQVKTLVVKVDRLETWYAPGLLLIGDAAHAMSPVGGVGINLAIQDAVAAANELAPFFLGRNGGLPEESVLHRIQQRRKWPTVLTQRIQLFIQDRVISKTLRERETSPEMPLAIRWLLKHRRVRNLPARFIGYGFRRERVSPLIRRAGAAPRD